MSGTDSAGEPPCDNCDNCDTDRARLPTDPSDKTDKTDKTPCLLSIARVRGWDDEQAVTIAKLGGALLRGTGWQGDDLGRVVELAVPIWRAFVRFGPASRLPANLTTSESGTLAELDKLEKAAKAIQSAIEALHRPALLALEGAGRDPSTIFMEASRIAETAAAARELVLGGDLADHDVARPNGRPRKMQARAVTDATEEAFRALTGKKKAGVSKPNKDGQSMPPRGPWIDTLSAVLDVLDIKATAAGQEEGRRQRRYSRNPR